MLLEQAKILAEEMGKLKGSVMKVGQMVALYGDHLFLPPEVVEVLRTLQDDSPPLDWSALQPVLEGELGAARLSELHIDTEPLAAASLGQVHRAWRVCDNKPLCIKIQYPGVADSIDSDLNTLSALLLFYRILPAGYDPGGMLDEVREMLHREVDYQSELENMQWFSHKLSHDSRYCVPEVFPEYSSARVITSSYEPGLAVDNPTVKELSQERRNCLGSAALEVFLLEFFRWNRMQTDPNFGNYRVRLDPEGRRDRLVLLDFGAVRQYSRDFLEAYHEMVRGAFQGDKTRLFEAAVALRFMPAEVSSVTLDNFAAMCALIVEPFANPDSSEANPRFTNERGQYQWGESDLPQRFALASSKASLSFSFRVPPREFVFLHRKLGGVFMLLSELNVELNARSLLQQYLHNPQATGERHDTDQHG
ncbi:MAG: AarF/ABC1/UbiB kinase family protein [Candidatus Competibacteraceae bacterium]|nr:AarF/ABC1/UbiB kinase family protein [Candidatus Competibacteraceae bacterium]